MHSFHQSRGRILFDAFCALAVAAASAVAWTQTDASGLLALAGVALAYALVHATDPPRREVATAPPVVEPVTVPAEPELQAVAEAEPKAKAKPRGRKKKAEQTPAVAAIAEAVEVPEVQDIVIAAPVEDEANNPWHPSHIEPLFEPQPALRQQRAVFGRKSG